MAEMALNRGRSSGTPIAVGLRMFSWLPTSRALLLALPLIPCAFALEHVGPGGFPVAEGCSGGGPFGGTISVPESPDGAVRIVSTSGYFPIELWGNGLEDIEAAVTTSAGEPVLGSLKELAVTYPPGRSRHAIVGWLAAAPLETGTNLKASVKFTGDTAMSYPNAGIEVALKVGEPPAAVAKPTITFDGWIDYRHGSGEVVSCGYTSCGTTSIPSHEEALTAVAVGWNAHASVSGFFAWEAHLELPNGIEPLNAPEPVLALLGSKDSLALGTLVFPKDSSEHCGVVVVRDLLTDKEERTDLCGTPTSAIELKRDFRLDLCSEPPPGDLGKTWCLERLNTPEACAASTGTAGSSATGTAGSSSTPAQSMAGSGGSADPGGSAGSAAAAEEEKSGSRAGTSSGCQAGFGRANATGLALAFAAAAFAAFRRREAARSSKGS